MKRRGSRLQRELGQATPFLSESQEAAMGLLRTAELLRRHYAEVIGPEGVTAQQYNVLRILRGAGPEGLPTLAITDRMIEQAPGITRLLDRLERKELIRRRRSEKDRREVVCTVTPKALRLLSRLDRPVNEADRRAVRALPPAERTRLIRLLDRIREDLG